jgi:hypothetical protein
MSCHSVTNKVLKSKKLGRIVFWGAEIWSPDMTFFSAYDALSLDFLVPYFWTFHEFFPAAQMRAVKCFFS